MNNKQFLKNYIRENRKLFNYIRPKAVELYKSIAINDSMISGAVYDGFIFANRLATSTVNFDRVYNEIRKEQEETILKFPQQINQTIDFYIALLILIDFAKLYYEIKKQIKDEDKCFETTLDYYSKQPKRTTTKC